MIEGQGLFNLAARSEAYTWLSHNKAALHSNSRNVFERNEKTGFGSGVTISSATTLRAFLQSAWEKVKEDKNLISDDMLNRLEKASKSDNKEIAAERLRQAKAKLRSLRLQAQMAAASGDPKTLRRIAQQAAQAAREVGSAARSLAEGIASSALTADGSASSGVPATTTGAPSDAAGKDAAQAQSEAPENAPEASPENESATGTQPDTKYLAPPPNSDSLVWGRDALRKLGDEARAAIAQARGIIAFAAQAARSRRNHRPDPDEDSAYRDLQRSVNDAEHDLDDSLNAAAQSLQSDPESAIGMGPLGINQTVATVETTTLVVQTTTVVMATTDIVV